MIELTPKEFKEKIVGDKPQAFIFYRPSCIVCEDFFQDLSKRGLTDYYACNINNDLIYYKTELGVWQVPRTRVYMKGIILWELGGQLFDTQIKQLRSVINTGMIQDE